MTNYKNIQVNETVTNLGASLPSCYLVILEVGVNDFDALEAFYMLRMYKSKEDFEANENWYIRVDEIQDCFIKPFGADFIGSEDIFVKISNEIKTKLLEDNPTWEGKNIIIE